MADPFASLDDFGNLEVPDLLCASYIAPEREFIESQTSLYQARLEDITLMEENFVCGQSSQLIFGDELVQPFNEELFHTTQAVDQSVSVISKGDPLPSTVSPCDLKRPLSDPIVIIDDSGQPVLPEVTVELDRIELPTMPHGDIPRLNENTDNTITSHPAVEVYRCSPIHNSHLPIKKPRRRPELHDRIRDDGAPNVQLPSHRRARHLIVDSKMRLTTDDLRYNMDHSEQTCLPSDHRLAQPFLSGRVLPRQLTRFPANLFTLPANLDNAFGGSLYELWCRHLCWCEQHPNPSHTEGAASLQITDGQNRQVLEASREEPRADRTTLSLQPPADSLLSASIITEPLGSTLKKSLLLSEDPQAQPTGDLSVQAAGITNEVVADHSTLGMVTAVTLLDTLPEEAVGQPQQVQLHDVQVHREVEQPLEYLSGVEVRNQVSCLLSQSEGIGFSITDLCPPESKRSTAALVFYTLLDMAKRREVRLQQDFPFGPINISSP